MMGGNHMKKICLLLILILALACVPALAASADGRGDMVTRNGELSAFVDGNGYIYVSGLNQPVNTTKASGIVSVDAYRILFFSQDNNGTRNLISLSLSGFEETVVTGDAYAACCYEDTVYYISDAARTNLNSYSLDDGTSSTVYTAGEALERVYASTDGVVCTLQDNAAAYISDATGANFSPYGGDVAQSIDTYDDFEVYLSETGSLYMQKYSSFSATQVDSSVLDWAVINDTIYYLSGMEDAMTLKSFDVDNLLWSTVAQPANLYPQLTASNGKLFVLTKNNQICTVNTSDGSLQNFASLPTLDSYATSSGKDLESYRIEAVSGQLNIYGVVSRTDVLPTFTFVESTSQYVADTSTEMILLSAYKIQDEETVSDLLVPAEQYSTLRRGSRGDAVSAIQQPLYDLGYYDYKIDGIYGWRTERAVKLAQAELGYSVTGVATEALQRDILEGKLPEYDPYKTLTFGDRGLRVTEMQQRLRELGYLADDADSIYGVRTEAAVELFQSENGLKATGVADSKTLRKLYSDSANSCSSYIDLRKGDSGYRVRELNRRLKALYYLEGEVGSTYNSRTVAAVRRFQEEVGLKQTGVATSAVQKKLFSRNAPEYSGYITLQRGDDNDRVAEMQQRLEDLGYPIERTDGYFDRQTKQMVRTFQSLAGLKATGVADPDTLEVLYSSAAPEYYVPEEIGDPVIELSDYTRFKDNTYEISDSDAVDGSIKVSWYADGAVESYDIHIYDDEGTDYVDNEYTTLTTVSVPLLKLDPDRRYTIAVTAHAEDGNVDDTYTEVDFIRKNDSEPDPEEIGTITGLSVYPTNDDSEVVNIEGVYTISGDPLTFGWSASGSVQGYKYYVFDDEDNVLTENEDVDDATELSLNLKGLSSNTVYTLTVTAVPTNGSLDDDEYTVTENIRFRVMTQEDEEIVAENEAEEEAEVIDDTETAEEITDATEATETESTEEITTDEGDTTDEMTHKTEEIGGNTEETETAEETEDEPQFIDETTDEPEATDETTEAETTSSVEAPVLAVEPCTSIEEKDGLDLYMLGAGTVSFSWHSDNVQGYNVLIVDDEDNVETNQNLTSESATLPENALTSGVIYKLTVTAYAADSEATAQSSCYFELVADESSDDTAEEEYTDDSAEEEYTDDSTEEEYSDDSYEEEYTDDSYEEEYSDEPTEEEYSDDSYEEEYTDDSYEEEYSGEPTEEEYGNESSEESFDSGSVEFWNNAITSSSDSSIIAALQQRLCDWGWLDANSYTSGTLDSATLDAVISFQNFLNDSGNSVEVTDASNPTIGKDTLRYLSDDSDPIYA